jgi:hypothetical protein
MRASLLNETMVSNMRNYLLVLLSLISEISFGQITGFVKDSVSNEPIPYVNIWVENENIGTSSNENGAFTLNTNGNNKTIIFSSIGYETKKVNSGLLENVVRLKPKITKLQEVVVKANKKEYEIVIGSFNKSEIKGHFTNGGVPWIVSRFFNFHENYKQTPFISKIRISTRSDLNNSKFNIRLYGVNEKGEPGDYIYDKNILGIAKKGNKMTEIDLSELHIKMPEQGVFIAVEGLIIESNKYEYTRTIYPSKKEIQDIQYAPSFGSLLTDTNEKSWIYRGGTWKKVWNNNEALKTDSFKEPYNLLAVELTLTN